MSGATFTTIDVPGASQTLAYGINTAGDISGNFTDSGGEHGFLLQNGTFETIDVTGAGATTGAAGLNDKGHIVGTYVDPQIQKVEGFLTNLSRFIKIHDPASSTTFPYAINNKNVIVGIYFDSFGNEMAFVATPQ
jgi:uncharacterized membrane protein